MKYSELNLGQVEAIVNKLGGMDGVQRFLRGEITVSEPARKWCEVNSIIYFSVTSDGTTGKGWVKRLEKKGFRTGECAKSMLLSDDFKPTNGVMYEIAVMKGMLFSDSDRTTKNIRAEADTRKFTKPNAEVACLIREKFTDEELEAMGLWYIVVMHEPINDSVGNPFLLGAHRNGAGRWLDAYYGSPGRGWDRDYWFAFVAS